MPAAAAAAVAVAAAVAGGASLIGAVASIAVSTGLSFLANKLLAPKPRAADFSQADRTLTFADGAASRPILYGTQRVGGVITFAAVSDASATSAFAGQEGRVLHLAIALAGHEVAGIDTIWFGDTALQLDQNGDEQGIYAGHMRVTKFLGAWDQAAPAQLVAAFPALLNSSFRGRNIAWLHFQLLSSQQVFPDGLRQVTARVRGRRAYDPRNPAHSATNPATWTHTQNPVIAIIDYLRGVPFLLHDGTLARLYGVGAADARIDFVSAIAEANACDEDIPLAAGGSEDRYTLNGKVDSADTPQSVLQEMLSALAGKIVRTGGVWTLTAGIARTPALDLSRTADLRGPLQIQHAVSFETGFTAATGRFIPRDSDRLATYPLVAVDAFAGAQGGTHKTQNLDLPFTDSPTMAQRIAKIMVFRANAQRRFTAAVGMPALAAVAGDWASYTDDVYGWDADTFEIDELSIGLGRGADGAQVPQVTLTLAETSATDYAWSSAEEGNVADPPFEGLPSALIVPPPSSISAQVVAFDERATVRVTVGPSGSDLPVKYRIGVRLEGSLETDLPPERRDLVRDIASIPVGQHVFVAVAVNSLGRESAPVETVLTVGPPNPVGRVVGLELAGRAHGTIFEGPDAEFVWREGAVQNPVGLDAPLGLDLEGSDPLQRDFRVRVRLADGRILRDEPGLRDPRFAYLIDMNRQDSRRLGLSGPQRAFSVEVVQRTRFGESEPSILAVSNPAPPQLPGLDVQGLARALLVKFADIPLTDDHVGFIVKSGPTGFDPDTAGEVAFQGEGNAFISAEPGDVFLRAAAFDSFGTAGLNWTSEILVEVGVGVDAATIAALEEEVAVIQTAVDGIDGRVETAEGRYTVQVSDAVTGQVVTGLTLVGGGGDQSSFTILADRFAVVNVLDGTLKAPFVVDGSQVFLDEAFARNLTAENLAADNLSALFADMGTITAGLMRSADSKFEIDLDNKFIRITV